MTTDPRARKLAEHRQRIAHDDNGTTSKWTDLTPLQQEQAISVADAWLRAAVEAGIAPAAERPTDNHDAVWIDDEGFLYGEYQTSPSSHGDAILRLVWASEQCTSKREMEDAGAEFRLLGWSH
jgi:hypothetical protein